MMAVYLDYGISLLYVYVHLVEGSFMFHLKCVPLGFLFEDGLHLLKDVFLLEGDLDISRLIGIRLQLLKSII